MSNNSKTNFITIFSNVKIVPQSCFYGVCKRFKNDFSHLLFHQTPAKTATFLTHRYS